MLKKPKILVVGSFMMDLIASTKRAPNSGETVIGLKFQTAPGGKGANQALQCARLGADVTMMGCWGTCCSSAYITGKHCRSCCRWPVRGCSALCSGPGAGKSAAMHKSKTDKCRRTCKYAKHSIW